MDGSLAGVQVRSEQDMKALQELRLLPARMERVDTLLEQLNISLDRLTTRLQPVLAPEDSRPGLVQETEQEPRTELAGWMALAARRLEGAVLYAAALADRVDL